MTEFRKLLPCKTCGRDIAGDGRNYFHTVWELNVRSFESTPEGAGAIYGNDAGSFCGKECLVVYLTKEV